MKKLFLPFMLMLCVIFMSACGNDSSNSETSSANANPGKNEPTSSASEPPSKNGTVTYQSELGPIEVPAEPQRIIALTNAPNVLSLEGTLVGVDEWTYKNPLFAEKLKGVEVVSDSSLERIVELDPDLIITDATSKNIDKLKKIAPTVPYTWGKRDYLAQQIEIGKLLNKEQEAKAWVDDFSKRAKDIGDEIKKKIGENATVSVFETDSKNFYVFGNAWARGTELLYQAMGMNMPEKVKADALGPGYYALSPEVLRSYAGDYIVLSRSTTGDNSFMKTDTWKNIPAVKNNHVIEIDTEASSYSDPTTLEHLLKIFKEGFLNK
ncbi:iron-hydroxamate ABC transporter substrate-binding protein [Paenibacillus sp. VCA1]|uniref:iron-hydroxamate ABC transporter substrate-binding protein n=1 Tax=Paenibacillus sp. VCA1 TaxID=3039148 RepID=UPI0028720DD3|nr:iron-hydroxamate ABC transporter substrate-binding protein [Paenibacillus sp. VCA1]MDR9857178.1 iron-hydroxamate ABC transporter substrate-binding protein [Paenibacillus sp. VCA1]